MYLVILCTFVTFLLFVPCFVPGVEVAIMMWLLLCYLSSVCIVRVCVFVIVYLFLVFI